MKHIESLPTGMRVWSVCFSNWVYTCTRLHAHTLSRATSVVKSHVVWYHVNTPLSGMVVVALTHCTLLLCFSSSRLPVCLYCQFTTMSSSVLLYVSVRFFLISSTVHTWIWFCRGLSTLYSLSSSAVSFCMPASVWTFNIVYTKVIFLTVCNVLPAAIRYVSYFCPHYVVTLYVLCFLNWKICWDNCSWITPDSFIADIVKVFEIHLQVVMNVCQPLDLWSQDASVVN